MTSDTFRLRYVAAGRRARVSARRGRSVDRTWMLVMGGLAGAGLLLGILLAALARAAEAPGRLLGDVVPASIREVQYAGNEWFGLVSHPSHRLKFQADFNDVAQMLGRGGFESQPPSHGWSGPGWWVPTRPWPMLQHFRRNAGECAVERVWWDPQTGEVLFLRYCQ